MHRCWLMRCLSAGVLVLGLLNGGIGKSAEDGSARISGTTRVGIPGAELAQLGPVVVYLERQDAPERPSVALGAAKIRQKNARFLPSFKVVVQGQSLEMPNDDTIFHNVFSFSRPNHFDLGLYPQGESRSVTFGHQGLVRAYCSIHENMNLTILVVPSSHFDIVSRSGTFEISHIEPGRYRLYAWSERLPPAVHELSLKPGQHVVFDLTLVTLSP